MFFINIFKNEVITKKNFLQYMGKFNFATSTGNICKIAILSSLYLHTEKPVLNSHS